MMGTTNDRLCTDKNETKQQKNGKTKTQNIIEKKTSYQLNETIRWLVTLPRILRFVGHVMYDDITQAHTHTRSHTYTHFPNGVKMKHSVRF